MTGSDRIWPVGGYAPGLYMCKCSTCGKTHHADKRAWQCADCVIQRLRDPAVLAALPEVQAMVAAAYEVAASVLDDECDLARIALPQAVPVLRADARAIRALTPADSTAALAARDRAMMAKGMREAAAMAWALEDGDRWTRAAAQSAILARAAEIERDAK